MRNPVITEADRSFARTLLADMKGKALLSGVPAPVQIAAVEKLIRAVDVEQVNADRLSAANALRASGVIDAKAHALLSGPRLSLRGGMFSYDQIRRASDEVAKLSEPAAQMSPGKDRDTLRLRIAEHEATIQQFRQVLAGTLAEGIAKHGPELTLALSLLGGGIARAIYTMPHAFDGPTPFLHTVGALTATLIGLVALEQFMGSLDGDRK